jgi:hypothetical protein
MANVSANILRGFEEAEGVDRAGRSTLEADTDFDRVGIIGGAADRSR